MIQVPKSETRLGGSVHVSQLLCNEEQKLFPREIIVNGEAAVM